MKPTPLLLALFSMGFLTRLLGGADHEQRKVQIQQQEAAAASAEALDRKARSTAFLKQKGVPTMEGLPLIEDSASTTPRSTRTIAERLIACTICAVGGETGDKALVQQLLTDFAAKGFLSPQEQEFIDHGIDDRQRRVQLSWRYERSWVLLWALGYVERLDYPPAICDVPKLARFIHGKSIEEIVKGSKPRPVKDLLDEADLIYRLDWAVVDERLNGRASVPKEIERGVVPERHAALNWLIGYMGQEWDDISTDT